MSRFFNDGSLRPPALLIYLNLDNLVDLRADSCWPRLEGLPRFQQLARDGFEGFQQTDDAPLPEGCPLPHCGCDRINMPAEADAIFARHVARGHNLLTIHAGWGLENDTEIAHLVEAMLTASERHKLPVFLETHRATITQDMWRTVQMAGKFPELRFNGDFSHYYAGQEMVYGGLANKVAFLEPIFRKVGFMHGRIASPGCMQVPITTSAGRPVQAHGVVDYLADFRIIWTAAMAGFLRSAGPGDQLIFCPELLAGTHYYARLFPDESGLLVEESDRYQQALLYQRVARECFANAGG